MKLYTGSGGVQEQFSPLLLSLSSQELLLGVKSSLNMHLAAKIERVF